MICYKYNSVSDISTKFTRFGVSLYTCNSDFAVEYNIFSLKIIFVLAGSVDPDEKPHYAAFYLGLLCLQL